LIFLVILVNIAIRAPAIYRTLSRSFERFPGDQEKLSSFDTSFRTNLLLVSYEKEAGLDDLAVVSYEPINKRLTVLFFDLVKNKKLQIMADHYFEKEGIAGLRQFISLQMAVPLDRYLAFEGSDLTFTTENVLGSYKEIKSTSFFFKAPTLKQDLNKILKTDLSTTEILTLVWKIRGAKFEEKDNIFLNKIGSGGFGSQETNEAIGSLFIDRAISEEAAAVTIQNSSGQSGLGTEIANYLNNLGATVVSVESGEEPSKKNILYVKKSKPYFEKRLASIIPFEKKKANSQNFSGDMLIIVGEEAAGMLTLP